MIILTRELKSSVNVKSCCLPFEQVTVLADDMLRRVALARPESKKIGIKFNAYVRQLTTVSRQIMASVSELSLVQVTASHRRTIDQILFSTLTQIQHPKL